MSEKIKVIDLDGERFRVIGENHDSYYVTKPYEEMEGDARWVPKSAARLVNSDGTLQSAFIPHKQRMDEWIEQWDNGDTKFIPDLIAYANALSRKLSNAADYGYRAEGRIKDLEKEAKEKE